MPKNQPLIRYFIYGFLFASSLGWAYGQEVQSSEANLLMDEGKRLFEQSKLSESLTRLRTAGEIFLEGKDWDSYFDFKYWETNVLFRLGKTDTITATIEQLLADCKSRLGPDHEYLARLYYMYAIIDQYALDGNQSIELVEKALSIFQSNDPVNRKMVANCYNHLGNCWSFLNDHHRAIEYFEQAIHIKKEEWGSQHPSLSFTYNNLGISYNYLGDIEKSLAYYQKSLEIKKVVYGKVHPRVSDTKFNIGMVYLGQENYRRAIDYFEQALAIDRVSEEQPTRKLAHRLISISECYLHLEEFDVALRYGLESLELYMASENINPQFLVTAYQNLGAIHYGQGEYALAMSRYQEGLETLVEEPLNTATFENPTIESWNTTERLYKVLNEKMLTFSAWHEQDLGVDKLTGGLATAECLIHCVLGLQSSIQEEHSKFLFLEDTRQIFEQGLDFCFQLFERTGDSTYLEKSFKIYENGKSILLRNTLREQKTKSLAQLPDSILLQDQNFREHLSNLNFDRNHFAGEEKESLRSQIFEEKERYRDFLKRIEVEYPALGRTANEQAISLEGLQSELGAQSESAIGWFVGESNLYTIYINQGSIALDRSQSSSQLRKEASALVSEIKDSGLASSQGNSLDVFQQFLRRSHGIYNLLFPPDSLASKSLVLIPDDVINLIPCELLISDYPSDTARVDYASLHFLIREHSIRYSNSFTLLLEESSNSFQQNKLLAFAPSYLEKTNPLLASRSGFTSLKFAQLEVEGLGEFLPMETYLGNSATEAQFKKVAGNYRFLHLAMHAFSDEDNPSFSGLIFGEATEEDEDEVLHAFEIANMSIPSELTVLSACNTGTGKLISGEGQLSLARSFRLAGSQNILMSLWQVDDESTSQLMNHFYTNLKSGLGKADALRAAKLSYLNGQKKLFPHYWAGFVLLGNNQSIHFPTGQTELYVGLLFLILLVLGVWRWMVTRAKRADIQI